MTKTNHINRKLLADNKQLTKTIWDERMNHNKVSSERDDLAWVLDQLQHEIPIKVAEAFVDAIKRIVQERSEVTRKLQEAAGVFDGGTPSGAADHVIALCNLRDDQLAEANTNLCTECNNVRSDCADVILQIKTTLSESLRRESSLAGQLADANAEIEDYNTEIAKIKGHLAEVGIHEERVHDGVSLLRVWLQGAQERLKRDADDEATD